MIFVLATLAIATMAPIRSTGGAPATLHSTPNPPMPRILGTGLSTNTIGAGTQTAGSHCSTEGTTVHFVQETQHQGDITIPRGQTYVIANMTFNVIGNFIVDGGRLIVRNATLISNPHPFAVAWALQNSGCLEFANANDLVSDDLLIGVIAKNGSFLFRNRTSPDNSALIVNRSTVQISAFLTNSNDTINIADSIWPGFISFTGWRPLDSTNVQVSDSLIGKIGLSFTPSDSGNLAGLHPGYIRYWNLHENGTVNLPYDVTLKNVTMIPNTLGPGPTGNFFGWGIEVGGYSRNMWPRLNVSDSRLTSFSVGWDYSSQLPITLRDLPSTSAVNLTLFDTIKLTRTIVDGEFTATFHDSNVTFLNSPSFGVWAYGKSNVTVINSTTIDFNPWNCQCTFNFVNSSWGVPKARNVTEIPYYKYFPDLASFLASSTGWGTVWNSRLIMTGELTFHWNYRAWLNSTATRLYPTVVTDGLGKVVANATVTLSTPDGRVVLWRTTDEKGRAEIPISFDDGNWTNSLVLTASSKDLNDRTEVSFLTDTPIGFVFVPPLQLSFVASPTAGIAPLAISFASTVSGGLRPYTYAWAFGDGGSSSQANPTHTYQVAGTYTVTLTVTDAGQRSSAKSLEVVAASPLRMSLSANPTSGVAPLSVTFTSTVRDGFGPYTYAWTFGDGGTSSAANPTHVYSSAGTFTATVVVTDSLSTQRSGTTTVTVIAPLSAVASADSRSGMIPFTISFSASASGGTGPYAYHWDFGDGTTSTLQNPSHTYQVAGSYTVILTVTDSGGQTTTKIITVTANSSPLFRTGTGIAPWEIYVVVAVVAVAVAAAFVVRRRRTQRPPE